jgi:cytoskeletal protein CcmA (bactofilin family)
MALFSKAGEHERTLGSVAKPGTGGGVSKTGSPAQMSAIERSAPTPTPAAEATARKLVVGRDILLTGEVTACDVLVVEGTVKADISGCKQLLIADGGTFAGKASVESADIFGKFDGDLSTSSLLWVRGSGKVDGKVRYQDLIVERGGRISGDVQLETTGLKKSETAPKSTAGRTSGLEGKTGPTVAA